jgi:hypothetical protein
MGADVMNIPAPPEGFELENQAPPPPEGFVLEGEQPAASSKPSGGSALEAFGSNYLDVPTMGMATAARAKIGSMIHGTSYPEEYQRIKSKQSAAQEAHPTASMIGTGAGIGASALLPARLATIPAALGPLPVMVRQERVKALLLALALASLAPERVLWLGGHWLRL